MVNSYAEVKGDQSVARKRPAAQGGIAVGTGTAQGGIGLTINGTPYFIGFWGDVLNTYSGSGTSWASGTAYTAGDHVAVDFVDYWAVDNNINSTPPSAHWSTTRTFYTPAASVFTKLVGVGLNTAKTSVYGFTWTTQTIDAGDWRDVAYANSLGMWAAVKSGATTTDVATTTDGITWTSRTTPALSGGFVAIAWSPTISLFAAVSINTGTSAIITSPDGITWTTRTCPSNGYYAITWGAGLFIAVGNTGISTSPDGVTWTARTCPAIASSTYGLTGIVYGGGKFVAVATAGNNAPENLSITSSDGITWALGNTCPWDGSGNVAAIAYSTLDAVYAVIHWSTGGTVRAATSTDGVTWTSRTIDNVAHRKVFWSPYLEAFVTNLGYYSIDGTSWLSGTAGLKSLVSDE